jgi:uncharacterized protein (TIGR03382 family)
MHRRRVRQLMTRKANGVKSFHIIPALLTLVLAASGRADVIFQKGDANGNNLSAISDLDSPLQFADSFILQPGRNVITDVHWWGHYAPSDTPTEPDNFLLRIFEDDGGVPAISPMLDIHVGQANRMDTGIDAFDSNVYEYSVDIPPTAVPAGVTHWLSVVNDTTPDTDDHWYWLGRSQPGGVPADRADDGTPWVAFGPGFELSFQLTNDNLIPEPATATLGLLAFIGLGAVTRRRRA